MKTSVFLLLIIAVISCGRSKTVRKTSPVPSREALTLATMNPEEQRAWRDRVTAKLWRDERVDQSEKETLYTLSEEAFLEKLLNDERFLNTLLDFNVYFLGFHSSSMDFARGSIDAMFTLNGPANYYYFYTPAIYAAKQFADNKDYLSLLTFPKKIYLAPMGREDFNPKNSEEKVVQRRKDRIQEAKTLMAELGAKLKNGKPITKGDFCTEDGRRKVRLDPFSIGFQFNLLFSIQGTPGDIFSEIFSICNKDDDEDMAEEDSDESANEEEEDSEDSKEDGESGETEASDGENENAAEADEENEGEEEDEEEQTDEDDRSLSPEILAKEITAKQREALPKLFAQWKKIIDLAESLELENYKVTSVKDFKELDLELFKRPFREFGYAETNSWFFGTMTNSSTNMNRKRAAYILKQYFCDDLTPINVELPEQHTEDAHGTNPSCFSCHYKLDPMAGFFRENGSRGFDFAQSENISFDDQASANKKDYFKNWQREDGSWNVGYVKSSIDMGLNTYPKKNNLEGLFELMSQSDKPKRCLVKKAFKYFIDEQVAYDGDFQKKYEDKFIESAKTDSVAAMKNLVKDLVRTQSFLVSSPEKGQCYDFAEGTDPANRPPCAINAILKTYCTSCHSADGSMGGLDLSSWDEEKGFKHADKTLDRYQVFERIEERLTTSDRKRRMPLNMHIDSVDLQKLYKWIAIEKIESNKEEK